ncbi:class I adenylate-forming enzyme family protein [Kitasatospora phosalacinea]|uniref:Class I adenylate-forming enzyme family protein n=1 Tax=Kitasatospora phosalacinea TaxID=2065 RepID=A0ABW6GT22_9ACTN
MRDTGIRARLAADPGLGTGNVLTSLLAHGADPDGPGAAFDVPVDGFPAGQGLTLGRLRERVAARAAWWHGRGIGPRDAVALYVSGSADCLLNFLALAWLGAVPALLNRHLPGDVAAEYVRRLRAAALLTDAEHRERLAGEELGVALHADVRPDATGTDAAGPGSGDPAAAPAPYRHHADDPVVITHSSGTTRTPAAVVHSHASLFAAVKLFRLAAPRARGTERILSALPAAHAAGVSTLNLALCQRSEVLFLSAQDGDGVLAAIERWEPTGVFGFAATWAQLARHDLTERRLDSVSLWFNTGDCAHEPHVRRLVAAGSRVTVTREGVRRVPGSHFVDGLGSTEMGHSAFHLTHGPDTERYGRCVGVPHGFAEVALLDAATGREVPVGEVGHFALKAPTLAPGYWNDSAATYRNRLDGYYLTGDLLYRDAEGYYFHVDRAVDAVDLGGGEWLYTALSEERILTACPDVLDCTVVSLRTGPANDAADGPVVTDVLLALRPDADPSADRSPAVRAALTPAAAATLRAVLVIGEEELVLGPTGKVRKFLMRQRHRAAAGAAGAAGAAAVTP